MNRFDWGLHPEASAFASSLLDDFLARHGLARRLADRMLAETSTRFRDWVDHMVLPESRLDARRLQALGYTEQRLDGVRVFKHQNSCLFPLLPGSGQETQVALKPEELDAFLKALGTGACTQGEPGAPLRKAAAAQEGDCVLCAVERRGYDGFAIQNTGDTQAYLHAQEVFAFRKRDFSDAAEGISHTARLIDEARLTLKTGRVCDAFIRGERAYWQRRNQIGRLQKSRQDSLGLGWGNHDHHTYRSSREYFADLQGVLAKLGFSPRERYYAGEQAGWGAQVLEHPVCGIVLFTDVDLQPKESGLDFARTKLEHRQDLGTVGLWIGLHGESLLQAGLHHLAARFDFEHLHRSLAGRGAQVMTPFSHFDFLKQAFTAGETWKADPSRLEKLLRDGSLTQAQHVKLAAAGALGSHLEDLERNQGFKGFNQSAVSRIIKATDPRAQAAAGA
jgi:hypothetical protein